MYQFKAEVGKMSNCLEESFLRNFKGLACLSLKRIYIFLVKLKL